MLKSTEEPDQSAAEADTDADQSLAAPPALDHSRAAAAVIKLAETLGPRPSGTAEEVAAAEHIASVLDSYGYDVWIEPFEYSVEQPIVQIFLSDTEDIAASRFRGSDPGEVEGRLQPIEGEGNPADYEGVDAAGAIVLVERGLITFAEKAQHAAQAGAAALIIINNDNTWLLGDLAQYRSPIPVFGVPRIQGRNLKSRSPQAVSISPSSENVSRSQNIIALRPDAICSVIVGAHYDTVYRTAGYNDNSSGTALMMEFARTYSEHPASEHLCFVGFGAEEVGIYGSREYVRRLEETGQLADVRYLLNLDAIGSGSLHLSLSVNGADLRLLTVRLAEMLGVQVASIEQGGWADAYPFAQAGVETFFPLPASGVMNTIADDSSNFDAEVFGEVARLAEHVLQCMLERSGAAIRPVLYCSDQN